jgi:hypothetical protein
MKVTSASSPSSASSAPKPNETIAAASRDFEAATNVSPSEKERSNGRVAIQIPGWGTPPVGDLGRYNSLQQWVQALKASGANLEGDFQLRLWAADPSRGETPSSIQFGSNNVRLSDIPGILQRNKVIETPGTDGLVNHRGSDHRYGTIDDYRAIGTFEIARAGIHAAVDDATWQRTSSSTGFLLRIFDPLSERTKVFMPR